MSKKIINVNKQTIAQNNKAPDGADLDAPIRVMMGSRIEYVHEVQILGPSVVIHRPEKPLKCGAKVWIETEAPVLLKYSTLDGHMERID